MKSDRSNKARGKSGPPASRGGPRKPPRAFGAPAQRGSLPPPRPMRERGDASDPYQPARRPGGFERGAGERRYAPQDRARGPAPERRGFTVTLDPDVARVFRGD